MKKEISSKLKDLRKYYNILISFRKYSLDEIKNDFILRGAVERYMQIHLKIVIEIGEMIISEEAYEKPSKNREIIKILGKHRVITRDFSKRFAPSAGLRNILVYRYGDIDIGPNKLYRFLKSDSSDLELFSKYIAKYLKKKK